MSFYGNQVNWVPMRWDGNEVYINGVNIKNYSLGEKIILNDSNNSALGDYTIAAGTNTAAGSNAFKILAVDKNNLTITLNSVNGLTVGLECSCQYDKNFDLFGTITAIDTENNIVTFSVLPSDVFTEGQTNVLWVPSHPELGDGETFVGTGATSFGHNNISSQSGSFAAGGDNIAAGKYSGVFGNSNIAGYCSAVFGQLNTANQWSFVSGYHNITKSPNTFTAGYGNIINTPYSGAIGHQLVTSRDNQFIVGCHNVEDTDAVFIVANGVAYTGNGSNALVVKSNGNTSIQGNANIGGAMISNVVQGALYKNSSGSVIINNVSTNNGYLGATGEYSFAAGNDITASGAKSFAFGTKAEATGSHSIAIGFKAKALLDGATAIGWEAEARNKYSAAFGIMTRAVADRQFVCGTWNNPDTDALFMVGNGTGNYLKNKSSTFNPNEDYYTLNSDGKTYTKQNITDFENGVTYYIRQRSSAFTVKSDGSAEVTNMSSTNNSVVTKKYVDTIAEGESGSWSPYVYDIIDGVQITFSNSEYYIIGKLISIHTTVNIVYEGATEDSTDIIFKNSAIYGAPFFSTNKTEAITDFGINFAKAELDQAAIYLGALSTHEEWGTAGFGQISKKTLYNSTYGKSSGSIKFDINITYVQT